MSPSDVLTIVLLGVLVGSICGLLDAPAWVGILVGGVIGTLCALRIDREAKR